MRRPLVLDAIELSKMVYWKKETLETFVSDTKPEQKDKNVLVSGLDEDKGKETEKDDIKSLKDKLEKPIKFYSSAEDAQCFVSQYESGLCMVFRGTTSKRDWMTNLDALQDPLNLPNVFGKDRPKVHGGFLRQFNSVSMNLMQHASEYMGDKTIKESHKTFYYFGHSLGGALSTIAALTFGTMYPDARHVCITFGSPRVGDTVFTDLFHKHVDESVRCVNQEDPVPFVPSACSFQHVYGLSYIDKNHKIQNEQTENRLLNTCAHSCLCCCGVAENPLNDHDLNQYKDAWIKI